MPHIEELHTSSRAAAPGWSYVVDTGFDPSKAAINPTSRKRLRTSAAGGTSAGDLTLRQATAIQRHLNELDRDNHKDVQIAVPKSKSSEGKARTTNVKRILTSGKDFAYYVEEEQALTAARGTLPPPSTSVPVAAAGEAAAPAAPSKSRPKPVQRASKTPIARRKSILVPALPLPSSSEPSPAPSTPAPSAPAAAAAQPAPQEPAAVLAVDSGSLLVPPDPVFISDLEIESLLAVPPLTYAAARSAPLPASAPPQRVFCEICGYWGRVRCLKCGARVCGLECRDAHDESRCLKFYA